jgi:hypothetical protein
MSPRCLIRLRSSISMIRKWRGMTRSQVERMREKIKRRRNWRKGKKRRKRILKVLKLMMQKVIKRNKMLNHKKVVRKTRRSI